ncbi:MAG: tRNA pseudouridine synthase [Proteobacteria bacterium]|nr:tRNA pseudouridine synthase [Pseudomonadota bacterium]
MSNLQAVPRTPRIKRQLLDVHGILLLDKPVGLTSNRALQEAKHLLLARKAGHTGSLDPLASGLLPLCFGEATKVSRFLLEADKRYRAVFRLGASTATGDSEGEVLETRPVTVSRREIESAILHFTGPIEQIPPMYSAIKQDGQPLYKLARAGIVTERAPRPVTVYEFTDETISLEAFAALPGQKERAARLIPADQALRALPQVVLSSNAAFYFCQGQAVAARPLPVAGGWARVYQDGGRFLGLGIEEDGQLAPRRLLHATEEPEMT